RHVATAVGDEALVGVAAHHLDQSVVAVEAAGVHVVDPVLGPQLCHTFGVAGVDARGVGAEDPQDRQLVLGGGQATFGLGDPGLDGGESGGEGGGVGDGCGGSHGLHSNAPSERVNTL